MLPAKKEESAENRQQIDGKLIRANRGSRQKRLSDSAPSCSSGHATFLNNYLNYKSPKLKLISNSSRARYAAFRHLFKFAPFQIPDQQHLRLFEPFSPKNMQKDEFRARCESTTRMSLPSDKKGMSGGE